jgi:hypothetical protein
LWTSAGVSGIDTPRVGFDHVANHAPVTQKLPK